MHQNRAERISDWSYAFRELFYLLDWKRSPKLSSGFVSLWLHGFEDPAHAIRLISRQFLLIARPELLEASKHLIAQEKMLVVFGLLEKKSLPKPLLFDICKYIGSNGMFEHVDLTMMFLEYHQNGLFN